MTIPDNADLYDWYERKQYIREQHEDDDEGDLIDLEYERQEARNG